VVGRPGNHPRPLLTKEGNRFHGFRVPVSRRAWRAALKWTVILSEESGLVRIGPELQILRSAQDDTGFHPRGLAAGPCALGVIFLGFWVRISSAGPRPLVNAPSWTTL